MLHSKKLVLLVLQVLLLSAGTQLVVAASQRPDALRYEADM
jgi:hypothetical protein